MNREKSIGGKYTLGSQTFVSAKLKAAKIVGHEFPFRQMWRQSHCKKGFRPLDKFPECTCSVVEDIDLEEDVEEQNLKWVDERSHETWKTYEGYLEEKYGNDASKHREFDPDLWPRAVRGKNKEKIYGLSNIGDPLGLITGTPSTSCSSTTYIHEIQKLNGIIEELVKEKEEDKEMLNGVIEDLVKEKERDKVEKQVILDRMTKFEELLQLVSQNIHPPS
ncbi:hypothetical protein L1987_58144 [Smallanthus sonchifolius]|uniref:Uncharacterized protein n=1 Tax=Smallanthus sonchifolius TaxID=185202 RepID=A0ACB9DEE0_9ASTR|nr:hypothetical protein L1987_58144 [Smallanthus sonchifolius]